MSVTRTIRRRIYQQLGAQLKNIRILQNMTIKQAAEGMNYRITRLEKIEEGDVAYISPIPFVDIVKIFHFYGKDLVCHWENQPEEERFNPLLSFSQEELQQALEARKQA